MLNRRHQRGSALVLTILVMFAIIGLGVVAMRSTSQNMLGAGNLRLTKQVRQVAEAGLYHGITLMNREGPSLLPLRDEPALRESVFTLQSTVQPNEDNPMAVLTLNRSNGDVAVTRDVRDPGLLGGDIAPLGQFQTTSGLTPSYTVVVTGFEPWDCPPGFDERALAQQDEGCCLMHFESTGRIAQAGVDYSNLGSTAEGQRRYAEHRARAGVVLGPFTKKGCGR